MPFVSGCHYSTPSLQCTAEEDTGFRIDCEPKGWTDCIIQTEPLVDFFVASNHDDDEITQMVVLFCLLRLLDCGTVHEL